MNITLRLEVTGDEHVLDSCAHQTLLDTGEVIREALNDAGVDPKSVVIAFSGDGMLEVF